MVESSLVGAELASRYRVERELGEGGMGRVYAALDLQLGRRVALKVIRQDVDDAEARARFRSRSACRRRAVASECLPAL